VRHTNEQVLLLAGEVIGLARRAAYQDYLRAGESPGLTPRNRRLVRLVAKFRRLVDVAERQHAREVR
jgi:hypothetical protein